MMLQSNDDAQALCCQVALHLFNHLASSRRFEMNGRQKETKEQKKGKKEKIKLATIGNCCINCRQSPKDEERKVGRKKEGSKHLLAKYPFLSLNCKTSTAGDSPLGSSCPAKSL